GRVVTDPATTPLRLLVPLERLDGGAVTPDQGGRAIQPRARGETVDGPSVDGDRRAADAERPGGLSVRHVEPHPGVGDDRRHRTPGGRAPAGRLDQEPAPGDPHGIDRRAAAVRTGHRPGLVRTRRGRTGDQGGPRTAEPSTDASRTHNVGESRVVRMAGLAVGKASTSSDTDRGTPIWSGGTETTAPTVVVDRITSATTGPTSRTPSESATWVRVPVAVSTVNTCPIRRPGRP